ncbi:NAD(P)/FAD-dependent oxidoreductase [Dolichospermum sp. LEGE 00240]|uniref:NAD(P)/FAD-dependent oxidoreductase n=1 Tax=Dolichospermum sp. LEGE 00240 TaxID=1828603 RepID=UPI00187F4F10|nr:NAD(P)/FAD-dependent oxidoreductase [Dolichospermum sp. LEGE 00240]MDM3846537.1 NAD(P)/FAD-dependent oxidoreductase [Aphanizomenon gracile PMC638.10]MDM3848629.1 NAD(P)/FAD-dependent oxidoreductase [Aphanizomenon gracile PMC627.10]MDM3853359.1 NAD(P)/FAD-dependent oxidoreductase [Aphanizomenon gracile PMC649.10]MDM3861132.1 NAD(P)/FAD-dependent oxidoreductase [Aphanizomenon gracile PMC644.10]MBE9251774.1 NAD(P)/FAD-dependent oxidoreductase [Dolichospermum sp. LEGE 00240]
MLPLQIVVIGGGAAGFFGAIACAEAHPQAQITLIEASRQPLAKVLISGGGRCNITHACFEPKVLVQNYPRGSKALLGAFTRFQPLDTIAWFAAHGVNVKTEADGRMFPITDRSETIAECLIKAAFDANIELCIGTPVTTVSRKDTGFEILLKSGETQECHRLLLATGSSLAGYKIARELGHDIQTPVPSLFTFNIADSQLRELAGISVSSVNLRLPGTGKTPLQQTGPLLITHWGISGPAVLKLSAWGARILNQNRYQHKLLINWLPDLSQEEVRQKLLTVKAEWGQKAIALHRGVDLPHRLWQYIINRTHIPTEERWATISNKTLNQLVQEISQGEYLITGKGAFKEEFVTCGGVNLKEVNFKTMESKIVPGLHFAGEILDIDGITGGFNFQSAWTTAYLAGQSMTKATADN